MAATAGVGLYKIIDEVRNQTESQIRLDQKTGGFAIRMRACAQSMEESLRRVIAYRALARTACATLALCPEAKSSLDVALTAEMILEQGYKVFWDEQAARWKSTNLFGSDYPEFPFPIVDVQAGIAGNDAETFWLEEVPDFNLSARSVQLTSTAQTYRIKHTWQVKWTE